MELRESVNDLICKIFGSEIELAYKYKSEWDYVGRSGFSDWRLIRNVTTRIFWLFPLKEVERVMDIIPERNSGEKKEAFADGDYSDLQIHVYDAKISTQLKEFKNAYENLSKRSVEIFYCAH